MLAKADKPDETRDQLSEGSHEALVLPPHSFNYKKLEPKFYFHNWSFRFNHDQNFYCLLLKTEVQCV